MSYFQQQLVKTEFKENSQYEAGILFSVRCIIVILYCYMVM